MLPLALGTWLLCAGDRATRSANPTTRALRNDPGAEFSADANLSTLRRTPSCPLSSRGALLFECVYVFEPRLIGDLVRVLPLSRPFCCNGLPQVTREGESIVKCRCLALRR